MNENELNFVDCFINQLFYGLNISFNNGNSEDGITLGNIYLNGLYYIYI